MCYLCLESFEFEWNVKPNIGQKKKRLKKIKSLLQETLTISIDSFNEIILCETKIKELKEEQYRLSREF